MTFADYKWLSYLKKAEIDTAGIQEEKRDIVRLLEQYGVSETEIAQKAEAWLNMPVQALQNVRAAKGSFPLVLFGNAANADGCTHALSCEYLAAQGYIAVCLPSRGLDAQTPTPFDMIGAICKCAIWNLPCIACTTFPIGM